MRNVNSRVYLKCSEMRDLVVFLDETIGARRQQNKADETMDFWRQQTTDKLKNSIFLKDLKQLDSKSKEGSTRSHVKCRDRR